MGTQRRLEICWRENCAMGLVLGHELQALRARCEAAGAIWRTIEVPGVWSLEDVHFAIQVAMGWTKMAEELRALKSERNTARKLFDSDPSKAQRIKVLEELKHNAERSAEMAKTLEKAGLPDTVANNEKIMEHLLEVGETVTPQHFKDSRSELVGRSGRVKLLSTWKVLPDGRAYLTTVKLIPIHD